MPKRDNQIIKVSDMKEGFGAPVYFERTGNWRKRVVDCTREELIDYVFDRIGRMDEIDGLFEAVHEKLENALGYNVPMDRE